MNKVNVVVLASGNGSNFQALVDACKKPKYPAKIQALITNVSGCYASTRALDANISSICIPSKFWIDRVAWEQAIVNTLLQYNPDIVCLAGFMKILSPEFFRQWTKPVLNIHPSLLPEFKGLDAQNQALESGVNQSGCTVHYVDKTLDGGTIIGQSKVRIAKRDTLESLTTKILKQEHKLYPIVLKKISREILRIK